MRCLPRSLIVSGKTTVVRYGIAEWYGRAFIDLSRRDRVDLAHYAIGRDEDLRPVCPFQKDKRPCSKKGGVCGLRKYSAKKNRIDQVLGPMVVTCPKRFEQGDLIVQWLADIVGFGRHQVEVAREVPFMVSTQTGRPAGRLDLVVAQFDDDRLKWHGLEIQAVYFSGLSMTNDFLSLYSDDGSRPPFPGSVRRPDWRSSSAKRLLPQLEVKVPELRRWGAKLAVCVDPSFFAAMGGPSEVFSHDLDSGDIVWMVPELTAANEEESRVVLQRGHWEVLTLEASQSRLLSAKAVSRNDFEESLKSKLEPFRR